MKCVDAGFSAALADDAYSAVLSTMNTSSPGVTNAAFDLPTALAIPSVTNLMASPIQPLTVYSHSSPLRSGPVTSRG